MARYIGAQTLCSNETRAVLLEDLQQCPWHMVKFCLHECKLSCPAPNVALLPASVTCSTASCVVDLGCYSQGWKLWAIEEITQDSDQIQCQAASHAAY